MNEDRIFFEQAFTYVNITNHLGDILLNCLRHSSEINNSCDILMSRFIYDDDEINFSMTYIEDDIAKALSGFAYIDIDRIKFEIVKQNYDTDEDEKKFTEIFEFKNDEVKRRTLCNNKLKSVSLEPFSREEFENFVHDKAEHYKKGLGR